MVTEQNILTAYFFHFFLRAFVTGSICEILSGSNLRFSFLIFHPKYLTAFMSDNFLNSLLRFYLGNYHSLYSHFFTLFQAPLAFLFVSIFQDYILYFGLYL